LHLTRDGGDNWADISPPHRGEAMINAIELSPHTEGTAYLAVTGYKLNDFKPYIYKTTNHGSSWKRIDRGLPDAAFVRVVREDPSVKGLLYAGTEKGMFVSYDDGRDWQSLDLNLPAVPITDLRAREDSIAVATQGRAFWVLDDVWVLREAANELAEKSLHLFTPPTWAMGKAGVRTAKFEGSNPSTDVPLYYFVRDEVDEDAELRIEIFDASGNLVRSMSSQEGDQERCEKGNEDPRRPIKHKYAPHKQGLNKWGWNMQSEDVPCISDYLLHGGYDGPTVASGTYTARVTIGDTSSDATFTVTKDRRSSASDAEIAEWVKTLDDVKQTLSDSLQTLDDARRAREQIKALMADHDDTDLHERGRKAIAAINDWEGLITQLKHETYEDEDAWRTMFDGQLRYLLDVIDFSGAPITGGMRLRLADLMAEWQELETGMKAIVDDHIEPINQWARDRREPHVVRPLGPGTAQ
jgi:hypothetical protein